jgi:hypothetical protein
VGAIALAVVLIAVPGPITALTFLSAKGAIAAALTQLATATGAGALAGRHMGRLLMVIREKLIGSPEFDAVRAAADGFRSQLDRAGQALAEEVLAEASALIIPSDDPLIPALEVLREPPGDSP